MIKTCNFRYQQLFYKRYSNPNKTCPAMWPVRFSWPPWAGLLLLQLLLQLLLLAAPSATAGSVPTSTTSIFEGSLNDAARTCLDTRNAEEERMAEVEQLATWLYESNLTDYNKEKLEATQKVLAQRERQLWRLFVHQGWLQAKDQVTDEDLKRQLNKYSLQGMTALPDDKLNEYQEQVMNMTAVYGKARVNLCVTLSGTEKCNLSLEPELTQLLTQSRNASLLQEAWVGWRDVSGKLVRDNFVRYVELANEGARLNNFTDNGAMWVKPYESDTFRSDVGRLWEDLRPLYLQLHAYVRRKLREKYGEELVGRRGPIPAHLLGNMWAQSWDTVGDIFVPYSNKPSIDVTPAMVEQGYTPLKMFQLADKFFTDLNLTAMPPLFWKNSILVKPPNTELVCHASAWDFQTGDDYRIKMCTDVTMSDLITIHHEMGHIEYYLQYKDQPSIYREGANPGFHEAVGDALSLSVRTPKHLHKVGLLNEVVDDNETDINFLLNVALSKVVFLPFGLLIDKYRWEVFSGNISSDQLNCKWWDLRYEMQGLKPPVKRSEKDFDPGAKYHVVGNVPYIRYFVSFIVQFQFHKAMCLKAGQYDPKNPQLPLHKCDIDKSAEAGNALGSMLQMGASRPWSEALKKLTGTKDMDVTVLREYFSPLEHWLQADNARHGEFIGWEKDGVYCE